jgi:beta-lactamase regulating signal transducer with metallopeptidase domain
MTATHVAWVEALLASLWQAPVLAVLAWLLEQAFAERASTRHAIRAAALMSMPAALVGTWLGWVPGLGTLLRPPPGATASLAATASLLEPSVDAPRWVAWILGAWLLGMLLMGLRTTMQWRVVQALRRTAQPLPPLWIARVRSLARALHVRAPHVALSSACDTPLVLGVLRPLVLLPMGLLQGVPPEVVEAALAHELMHLRRLDPWLHTAQVAVEIILFFNPAVWWMSWRLGSEREHACDEAVLRARAQPPLPYARALVELEAWRQRPSPALTLGLGGSGLRARVLRLVRPRRVRKAQRWAARAGVLGVVVLLAFTFGRLASAPPAVPTLDPLGVAWLPPSVRLHQQDIERAARRHGVEPGLLAIMVYTESRGRADARSSAGARGLMQIMPSTAAEIAQERGLPAPTPARLQEPAYNLDMGAWYMARQLDRFGELPLALAAYNAGPGRVAAYRRGEAALPEETRRYQATITALWRERWLPWSPTLASRAR